MRENPDLMGAIGRASSSEQIRDALARRDSYPHHPSEVVVRETHISWVFLAGEFAYKLKKPIILDFLDYGTAERRREMCEEEVRLNRRLAGDLYLGVRGVAIDAGKAELTSADDPRAIDYVVEMHRYDERDTVASRLTRGELTRSQVDQVAAMIARFHGDAPSARNVAAPVLAAERRFEENVQELLALVPQRAEIGRVQALERFAHAFISAHAHTFQRRADEGWVRDGHGDLRAEHVLVDGRVRVVDCVEFDFGLRQLDVADDLAFLVLDLTARGAAHLARRLVQSYRGAGGDPGEGQLVSFYAAYRALVRAKVALVRAAQEPAGSAAYGRESAAARDLIAVADHFAWRARTPLIIVVCGLPASGKSHLAGALARTAGLPHLSSDVTRKQLVGIGTGARAPAARYSADWNARTYAELAQRADEALGTQGGAIVDATFRHAADRRAFNAALNTPAPVLFLECRAPREVLAKRAAQRDRDPRRVSDADQAVVLRELASWEPLDEVPGQAHIALRTDRATEEVLADLMALLDRRLAGGELPIPTTG